MKDTRYLGGKFNEIKIEIKIIKSGNDEMATTTFASCILCPTLCSMNK